MGKIKLLFLVTEFWQAGGQRYTYEIDSALDKKKFESSTKASFDFTCIMEGELHP